MINNSEYKKRIFILGGVLLIIITLISLFLLNSRPRFTGSTPSNKDIAEFSAIRLNFNKEITNKEEVISSFSVEPLIQLDVVVDNDQIIIVPIEYYQKSTKYIFNIPLLKFGNKEIRNFKYEFEVLSEPTKKSSAGNIDEGDFLEKKYPDLAKLVAEDNPNYKIGYELGDRLIISIDILTIKKIDEELSDYLAKIDKYNNEAKKRIEDAGIDLNSVSLFYPNQLQRNRYSTIDDRLDGDGGVYPFEE